VGKTVYDYMVEHRTLIITAGLIFAVIDVFLTRTPGRGKTPSKH
jgi:hypothetical protein